MKKINLKSILIIILLVLVVATGILIYFKLSQKEIKLTEIKKEEIAPSLQKEKIIETSLEELKEGKNEIGEIIVEKIFSKNKFLTINSDSPTQFTYQNNTYWIEPFFIPLEEVPATHMDTEHEIKIIKNGIEKK